MQTQRLNINLRYSICALLVWFTSNVNAQSHLNLEANFLIGFHNQKELNQHKLTNSRHLGFRVGGNWQVNLYKDIFAETGLYGKFIHGHSETELSHFSSRVISLQMPIRFGVTYNKWEYSGGLTFENNRDFEDMNINLPFNLRCYASIKASFQIHSKFRLGLSGNFNVSNTPDSYLIVNPANYISLGLIYKLI